MIKSSELNFYFVDLDGTLIDTNERENFSLETGKPIIKNIELIRKLAKDGRSIFIHTSRHWMDYRDIKKWLKKNKIPFKAIICGKPMGKYYVDDRALNPFCNECMSKL